MVIISAYVICHIHRAASIPQEELMEELMHMKERDRQHQHRCQESDEY